MWQIIMVFCSRANPPTVSIDERMQLTSTRFKAVDLTEYRPDDRQSIADVNRSRRRQILSMGRLGTDNDLPKPSTADKCEFSVGALRKKCKR